MEAETATPESLVETPPYYSASQSQDRAGDRKLRENRNLGTEADRHHLRPAHHGCRNYSAKGRTHMTGSMAADPFSPQSDRLSVRQRADRSSSVTLWMRSDHGQLFLNPGYGRVADDPGVIAWRLESKC
jgi:hypothetical protein